MGIFTCLPLIFRSLFVTIVHYKGFFSLRKWNYANHVWKNT